MRWLFAIIPLNDFDREHGPLLVSPGSHKLTRVVDPEAHILDVTRPDPEQLPDFVDPELGAGDLLLMDMHTWHDAPAGTTSDDRVGIFNKYCAVNAPPAAGYYPYDRAAWDALSDVGKRLIPLHFDRPLTDTRLLIESTSGAEPRYLLTSADGNGSWELPGGPGWEEEGAGWDVGCLIGSLQSLVKSRLDLDIPWASYIEDAATDGGASRVYGYADGRSRSRVARRRRLVHPGPAPEHARRVPRHLPRCLDLAPGGSHPGQGQGCQPEGTAVRVSDGR